MLYFCKPLLETSIDILGIHVQEPVTILTNFLISVSCFYMYLRLNFATTKNALKKYWRFFFLFFGINTTIAIVAHGFKSYFADGVFYYVWLSMNLASVPVTYYLLKANIDVTGISEQTKKRLNLVIIGSQLFFIVLTILLNNFVVVKISALLSILVSIGVHYKTFRKGFLGSGYIAGGFAVSISALIIHGAKLSLSEWFNFKDISHVIMNISLIMIFIGVAQKLKFFADEEESLSTNEISEHNEDSIKEAVA